MMSNKVTYVFIVCMSISVSVICMDEPAEGDSYDIIKLKHEQKLNNYIRIQAGLSAPHLQVEDIQKKLCAYEKKFRIREEKALEAIRENFCQDKVLWQACMSLIGRLKHINKENAHLPLTNFVQDKNLPYDFMQMIQKEARENGVNLERIHIQDKRGSLFLLDSLSPIAAYSIVNEAGKIYIDIVSDEIAPGKIETNMKIFSNKSLNAKKVACMYLIEPLKQEFDFVYEAIGLFERLYIAKSDIIRSSEQFEILQEAHTQLCTLLPSLRSKNAAKAMRKFHYDISTENLIGIGDYNILCRIYRHWKTIAWLKTYCCKQIPRLLLYGDNKDDDRKSEINPTVT